HRVARSQRVAIELRGFKACELAFGLDAVRPLVFRAVFASRLDIDEPIRETSERGILAFELGAQRDDVGFEPPNLLERCLLERYRFRGAIRAHALTNSNSGQGRALYCARRCSHAS